jgi:hypothetical protein
MLPHTDAERPAPPCGIYGTAAHGVEVRVGFSSEDLLRSQVPTEIGAARESLLSGGSGNREGARAETEAIERFPAACG